MPAHWIGLDVGSSSVRALLLDGSGRARLAARRTLTPERLRGGRVAYDPEAILEAASWCVRAALRRAPPRSVRAVGMCAQRSTFLLWRRADGRPLSPALGWQSRDGICAPSSRDARRVARLTGLRWSVHYSGPRIAALLRRQPALGRALASGRACLGTLDAFLRFRWSRGRVLQTDPTHAQRTLLYSRARGGWDPRLLRSFGVPRASLPHVGPTAGFSEEVPGASVPLTASCGDQQAALYAVEAHAPGAVLVNYGTGAFVLAACRPRAPRPAGLLLAEAVNQDGSRGYALEAPVPTAAGAFRLLSAHPLRASRSRQAFDAPILVAATDGLGAPFWLDSSPSLLLFDRLPDGPSAVAAAEFALAASVHAALERLGRRPHRLMASGGLSNRVGLLQSQADLAGRRVEHARLAEWSALGAALLAAGPARPRRLELSVRRFTPSASGRRRALRAYDTWRRAVDLLLSIGAAF